MGWPLAVMAGVGAAADIFGKFQGASEKKKSARKQSKFTYAQRMEDLRRQAVADDYTEGTAVAQAGASGVMMTGSTKRYIDSMRQEHSRQAAWGKQKAETERRLIRDGGDSPGLAASVVGSAAKGISSVVGAYDL
jgi:hypothetical protein